MRTRLLTLAVAAPALALGLGALTPASAAPAPSPAGDVQRAYCAVLEKLGYDFVQECNFID